MKKLLLGTLQLLQIGILLSNNLKLKEIMATNQERFDAINDQLDSITNDIAQDYQTLLDQAKTGKVSEESFAKAESNIAKLKEIGSSVENPAPTPEPTPEPEPTPDGGDTPVSSRQSNTSYVPPKGS